MNKKQNAKMSRLIIFNQKITTNAFYSNTFIVFPGQQGSFLFRSFHLLKILELVLAK